jgi:L,D-transpeptidase YcbB
LSPRDLDGLAPAAIPDVPATAAITLPMIAPAEVVIAPADLAGLAPPVPPAVKVEPAPVESRDIGAIPAEAVKTAIQRLKAGTRITDAEAAETLTFYEARNFAPLWVENGQWNGKARALRARLAAAAEEGLDAGRYRSVSAFHAGSEPHWPALAAAEAQLTESLLLYAREAATGRTRPQQIHALLTPRLQRPSARAVLSTVLDASDAGAALFGFNPQHPEFFALRKALEEARNNRPTVATADPIPDGPPLRIGMRDPRVPLIRARLGLGYNPAAVYDRNVSVKVASLQRDNGLPVTGAFTPMTRRVLMGEGPSPEEADILANMEFWRWMPRDLGDQHILVNAPGYGLQMRKDGKVVHEARIIIGKGETQTPFFSDLMDHIVVNPSWYIPPGILKREPKYLNPEWAAARGYELRTRGSVTTVRVPPSASNALGYVKFMFPNEHSVYLHDTPKRGLFNAQNRALSNGCVRVENPFQLAALLFASEGWTEERFRKLIGGGERHMKLPRKLPVHLAYFTLAVDAEGKLARYPDVYGHTARLKQLLGLS